MFSLRRFLTRTLAAAAVVAASGCDTPTLPSPTSACPTFVNGYVTFQAGGQSRSVRLYMNPTAARNNDGPLVLHFYGTGGAPEQAATNLTQAVIDKITAAGGVVAAPRHINSGVFPWIFAGDTDLPLVDEIVACAKSTIGIDSSRIHATGFSAGGIYASGLSWQRSRYLASVASISGGSAGSSQDPSNKFAAMIIYGGSGDQLIMNFEQSSLAYRDQLVREGNFAFLCNHGGGHRVPTGIGEHIYQFFMAHPYKVASPYRNGLPSTFPSYCRL